MEEREVEEVKANLQGKKWGEELKREEDLEEL